MTKVCVSLTADDAVQLVGLAREGKLGGADVAELRLDHVRGLCSQDLRFLRKNIDFLPLIATVRPAREGGGYRGSELDRTRLLATAIECGFDLVDMELGTAKRYLEGLLALCRVRGVESIVSFHGTSATPGAGVVARKLAACARLGDIAKVAFTARSRGDTLRLLDAVKRAGQGAPRRSVIGMGEAGRLTRALAPFLGCELAYAGLERGRSTAPGQLDLGTLAGLWGGLERFKRAGPSTGLFGILGFPLGHTLSPAMHDAAFRSIGLDAVLLPFETAPGELGSTLLELRAFGLRGANVTIPHKESILRHLDALDGSARAVGAVNTVLNRNGTLMGFNTDVVGFTGALVEAGFKPSGARAVVIGAGGAARAATFGLLKKGASVVVASRERQRALGLKARLGGRGIEVADLDLLGRHLQGADLLVNCTPLGMKGFPARSPVPAKSLHPGLTVFDMVYNPVLTPLLRSARERGARTIPGMEMFLRQGRAAFKIWTGRTVRLEVFRRAIGLAGAGKSHD